MNTVQTPENSPPSPLDLALSAIADKVADFEAAAWRCDLPSVNRPTLATEYRAKAEAVLGGLVAALMATAGPAGDGHRLNPHGAALALVDAATRERGGTVAR
jgi:hypothetical protein